MLRLTDLIGIWPDLSSEERLRDGFRFLQRLLSTFNYSLLFSRLSLLYEFLEVWYLQEMEEGTLGSMILFVM